MEGTRLTSRHGPLRARNGHPSPFKGSAVLFQGCDAHTGRTRVGVIVSRELTLALPHSTVQWQGWPHWEGWQNSAGI
jgi:hypothetical protein